ncbi:MAG TPA: hypothetical protein VMR98_02500, partial [Candidatus Polarisedimenticolaceae bacterium]|nr:hypothetical protein [Candidatus Polarisedimenticolaceae bacterium]
MIVLVGLFLAALSLNLFVQPHPATAAAGVNQQVNFQGKVVNPDGTNIPNGTYNIEFKIYQDGNGVLGGGDETLKWTESRLRNNSQGVVVTDGIFQVNLGSVNNTLGSAVDFNQDTLWLSINVGNTNATCTPFSGCSPDGEMDPFIRFTSAPYAMNSGKLGGLTSSQFVQIAPGAVQADSSTASTIFLNKSGASGNILQLQKAAADVFVVGNAGNTSINTNSTSALLVQNGSNNAFGVDTTNIKVAIGLATTSAASRLAVAGQGLANGITLGDGASGSANLYVSANDTLKTDDAMIVTGLLTGSAGLAVTGNVTISNTGSSPYTTTGLQLASTFSSNSGATSSNQKITTTNAGTASGSTTRGLEITQVDSGSQSNTNIGLYIDAATANGSDTQIAAILGGQVRVNALSVRTGLAYTPNLDVTGNINASTALYV